MIQPWSIGIYARQCGMSTCHVFVIESNDARTLGKRGVQKPSPFPFVSSSFTLAHDLSGVKGSIQCGRRQNAQHDVRASRWSE